MIKKIGDQARESMQGAKIILLQTVIIEQISNKFAYIIIIKKELLISDVQKDKKKGFMVFLPMCAKSFSINLLKKSINIGFHVLKLQ